MRRFSKGVARGVVAVAVVMALAVPVEARPNGDRDWSMRHFLKAVKRFVVNTFGDGITVPRP